MDCTNFRVYRAWKFVPIILLTVLLLCFSAMTLFPTADEPVFSKESGFYDEPFYLEIKAPEGCRVYYTLDGSEPDKNSTLYKKPIYVENVSQQPNTISNIPGMSIQQHAKKPDYLIEKCVVIRAKTIPLGRDFKYSSEVVTKTYFVGYPENYFDECGVISIATDSDNFFSGEYGIYVMGNKLETYLAKTDEPDDDVIYQLSNYFQRGKAWERDINISFFTPDREFIESSEAGIRIQGGASRVLVPRGLNIYAREDGFFKSNYFDDSYTPRSITLSAGGNQYTTLFNDYFISERVKKLNYATMVYKPCVMFLNGEYWGFYWLTEKYDDYYLQSRYNIPTEDIIMVKNEELAEGSEGDLGLYGRMVQFITTTDMADDRNYEAACELIDIDSFIDYYATMVYIGRCFDWPGYNEALWRTKAITDQEFVDGKWRWLMFDCNSDCITEDLITHNTLDYVVEESPLFGALWENEGFKEQFERRIFEIADKCFAADEVRSFIENYKVTMVSPLSKSWSRFLGKDYTWSYERFIRILDSNILFFEHRRSVVDSWFS